MNADIEGLDADLKAQWKIIESAREEARALRELRDEALDAHLATLTDEQIMGDEQLLRQVLREAWSHSGASRIVKRLYATGRQDVTVGGVDGRDEWADDVLPALQLHLTQHQGVAELEEAIKAWASTWAMGRPDLHIGITERTLSRWGSYHILYRPGKVVAELVGPYGREILTGPLRACLERAASDCYYLNPDGTPAGDDRPDYDY